MGGRYHRCYGRGCSLSLTAFRPFSPVVHDINKRYFVSCETLYLFVLLV
nr:MAG TPA: hypothetical protein [Caudoviricetes sp.]